MRYLLVCVAILLLCAFFVFNGKSFISSPVSLAPFSFQKSLELENQPEKTISLVVVGDIMLGRFVEELSLRNNDWGYPFASTSELFAGSDIVFGNFEGTVPKIHKKTPIYGYQFSVRKEAVDAARRSGINVVSLANNHSSDFGDSGYKETVEALKDAGIASVGTHADYSYEKDGIKIRLMGLNDTFTKIPINTIPEEIRAIKKENEFLIIAVHFGEEYATISNARQKELARALIDAGADVVIGHHPHVVQEIETYRGKPIFYSLGNFIFDQYFSEETQKGLAVKITIGKHTSGYTVSEIDLHKSRPKVINLTVLR